MTPWTPFQELDDLLVDLVSGVRHVLGTRFVGAYLQGSFALGDADLTSDVDFVVVTTHDLDDQTTTELEGLHARLFERPQHWAQHLEGSYVPRDALVRPGPEPIAFLYLDNGSTRLERSAHDDSAVVRWVLREHGVTLEGPPPTELVDVVTAEQLRREALLQLLARGQRLRADPHVLDTRWAQSFAVLTLCRMLYTLATGTVGSKPAAAAWALARLGPEWSDVVGIALAAHRDGWTTVVQSIDAELAELSGAFADHAVERGLAGEVDRVAARELELLEPAVRTSAERLDDLLDPEFTETGASGRFWTRPEMVAALLASAPGTEPVATVTELDGRLVGPDLVLLMYVSDAAGRRARRSSLWRRVDGPWRVLYHQGTLLP